MCEKYSTGNASVIYYLTPIRIATVGTTKSRTDMGKLGLFHIVGKICKLVQLQWKIAWKSSGILKLELPYKLMTPFLNIH